jgi:hypothetical protein
VFEVRIENLPKICKKWIFELHRGILAFRLCFYYPILFINSMLNNHFYFFLFWVIRYCLGVYFIIEIMLVDY